MAKPTRTAPIKVHELPTLRPPDVRNFVEELVELRVGMQAPNDPSRPFGVTAVLRVAHGDIADGDRLIPVAITALDVILKLSGFEPADEAIYGEIPKSNEIVRTLQTEIKTQKSGTLEGKAGVALGLAGVVPSLSGSIKGKIEQQVATGTKYKETVTTTRVTARPNHRWEVREPDGRPLNDSFLTGQTLCSLNRRTGANQMEVTAFAAVKQRDLIFGEKRRPTFFQDKLREKLTRVFIAKCINGGGEQFDGRVILSKTVISSDG